MKLLNRTSLYFAGVLLIVLAIWSAIFYVNMLDEVYDSLDDGLDNYKMLIIQKAQTDSSVFHKTSFDESNYLIKELPTHSALQKKDLYKDTLMYMQNEKDYEPVRILTTAFEGPGNKFYELKVISSMVEEDDLIEDLFYSLIWLYVALLVILLLINNFLLKRIWKPFYKLLQQLKIFRLGDKETIDIPQTKIKEFRDLNQTIKTLLDQTVSTYTSQKQFIENAAHELQTPLAISLNKLELMAENENMSENAAETLNQVMETLQRLSRLNRSLLLLSKIENKQFTQVESLNINQLLHKIVNELDDYIAFKEVTVDFVEKGNFIHPFNKDLAEILLNNLIKNAVAHNIPGGTIAIIIDESKCTIRNTGNAKPLENEKIFNRFYKSSTEVQSTGLGLSIVKAIADMYNITITYSFKGMHNFSLEKN